MTRRTLIGGLILIAAVFGFSLFDSIAARNESLHHLEAISRSLEELKDSDSKFAALQQSINSINATLKSGNPNESINGSARKSEQEARAAADEGGTKLRAIEGQTEQALKLVGSIHDEVSQTNKAIEEAKPPAASDYMSLFKEAIGLIAAIIMLFLAIRAP